MYYTYILQSQKDKTYYAGSTEDLKQRIKEHNNGRVIYTSSRKPYKLVFYCAFPEKEKAYQFEKYLKTGSGNAFFKKRLV
ncbi:GIY-YIG nuclease family protein [Patescibacteria group bacterium]|nr:GIY-YIG nuclease family protein [Patescibacteria group bacterium]MBU4458691.1 GIY-YIG nuclease family protein [Patescibacteria group bacterium]MCG2696286.1 GIY-YIG nuclease family protein [Candidatus Portnoybacteria bacterium]